MPYQRAVESAISNLVVWLRQHHTHAVARIDDGQTIGYHCVTCHVAFVAEFKSKTPE